MATDLTTDVERIIREYFDHLYDYEFDNLKEIVESLERHNLPKLLEKEINNINKHIYKRYWIYKINFFTKITSRSTCIHWRIQTVKEELKQILYKLFQKSEEEGKCSNTFYKVSITLITNPGKTVARKESYKAIYIMNIELKILKILAN